MFPELHVTDCEAAAQFFEKALGYGRGFTLIENGELDFAVMDGYEILFQQWDRKKAGE